MPLDNKNITSVAHVEQLFVSSLKRLHLDDYSLCVPGTIMKYAPALITSPAAYLPRLAYRADELCSLIFNSRIFPHLSYLSSPERPGSISIIETRRLTSKQRESAGFKFSEEMSLPDSESLTVSLLDLVIDAAVADTFNVDAINKTLTIKDREWSCQGIIFASNPLEDGDVLPVLSSHYLSVNELISWINDPASLEAVNKARKKAEQIEFIKSRRDIEPDSGGGL